MLSKITKFLQTEFAQYFDNRNATTYLLLIMYSKQGRVAHFILIIRHSRTAILIKGNLSQLFLVVFGPPLFLECAQNTRIRIL